MARSRPKRSTPSRAAKSDVPEFIEDKTPVSIAPETMTIEDLIKKAEANGFKQADIVTGARIYHNQPNIYHLTDEQIADLDQRMSARVAKTNSQQTAEVKQIKRVKTA